jgi:hypothetical protein
MNNQINVHDDVENQVNVRFPLWIIIMIGVKRKREREMETEQADSRQQTHIQTHFPRANTKNRRVGRNTHEHTRNK